MTASTPLSRRSSLSSLTPLRPAQALAEIESAKPGPEIGAYFDLDGTLVEGFTAWIFLEAHWREHKFESVDLAPFLRLGLESLLGRSSFRALLERALAELAGRPIVELEAQARALFESEIRSRLRAPIVELVFAHRERGHTVVLASSATNLQTDPVAAALGIDAVLCNRIGVDGAGRSTGQLEGDLLWATSKARAVQRHAARHGIDLAKSWFYADGGEDVSSMFLVGNPRPVNPRRKMRAAARRRGWPSLLVPDAGERR